MTERLQALVHVFAGFLLFALLTGPSCAGAEERVRTISASGQIVAYARTPLVSSQLCALGEGVKRKWLLTLGLADKWRDPIVLVEVTNHPPMRVLAFQTPLHLKYQIDCGDGKQLDADELKVAVVHALCAEWANRSRIIPHGERCVLATVPLWLSNGLFLNMEAREEVLLPAIRHVVNQGPFLGSASLLTQRDLPSGGAARQSYLAQAWLWTRALMALPGGGRKMERFLCQLGAQKSAEKAFAEVYGADFSTELVREKWWNLILAEGASAILAEDYSAAETSRRLRQITEGAMVPELLSIRRNELAALEILAHPSYRKVIAAYVRALDGVREGEGRRQHNLLEQARRLHARADAEAKAIADYLDKFDK